MNKLEEKFKKVIPIHVTQKETEESMRIKRNLAIDAAKQCAEITQEVSIGFANFLMKLRNSEKVIDDTTLLADSELFKIYIENNEKERSL